MSTDLAPSTATHRVTRVLLAALRLGAIYAVGVTTVFLVVILGLNAGAIPIFGLLARIWIPAAALMLFAFVTLALARGLGFLVLWALALLGWAVMLRSFPVRSMLESEFLLWSMLAAPLSIMVALGQPESITMSRKTALLRRSMTIVWVALFAFALVSEMASGEYVSVGPLPGWLSPLLFPLWIAMPFIIGFDGVRRAMALLRAHRKRTA